MMKGQYFSFDAIIAAVIFVASISLLTTYWFGVRSVMDARSNDMFAEALRVSDSLLTPGNPVDWNKLSDSNIATDAEQIGFTSGYRDNILNKSKVDRLRSYVGPNYMTGKDLLHITDDYYITIINADGAIGYKMGNDPLVYGAKNVANAQRAAVLDGKLVTLRIQLWNNRTTS